MHRRRSTPYAVVAALIALTAAGCLPTKLTIDLAPQPERLGETDVIRDKALGTFSPKVALIDIEGPIGFGEAPAGLLGGAGNSVDRLVANLERAEKDDRVRAIVLRVNSPGGTVAASETMYRELRRFREKTGKPIIVSMGEVAASGGYFIALAADHLIAQESTITGSIGVIFQTFNFSRGMGMIGVEGRAVTSAKNKDVANPFAPPRDEHYAILQAMVDDFYASFRGLVSERRPALASSARLDEMTDGRVVTGKAALAAGLIDELGGVREAFDKAKSLAGVEKARLVKYHASGARPMSPYAAASGVPAPSMGTRVDVDVIDAGAALGPAQAHGRFMYLWTPDFPAGAGR
ncbi:MAG: signal peptide peptidase SppA [Phycisphaerales bacterium]